MAANRRSERESCNSRECYSEKDSYEASVKSFIWIIILNLSVSVLCDPREREKDDSKGRDDPVM